MNAAIGKTTGVTTIFNAIFSVLWAVFDVVSQVFALVFYIFVAVLGVYGIASVVYNLVLAHKRHNEKRPEPPTARQAGTVYPDGKEAPPNDTGAARQG